MKETFLRLVETALGAGPLPEQMVQSREVLAAAVKKVNVQLGLKGRAQFVGVDAQGRFMRAPVPFVSAGSPIRVAILGLNPKLDHESDLYQGDWEGYAAIHTSPELQEDHVFRGASRGMGPYYRKVAMLVTALTKGVFMSWAKPTPDDREERSRRLIRESPLCVAELIPFHSNETTVGAQGLAKLRQANDSYGKYLTGLLQMLDQYLAEDGWLVCNGVGPCQAVREFLGSDLQLECEEEAKGYSFGRWKGRKVIFLHHFLGTTNQPLNAHREIREMFSHAYEHYGLGGWTHITPEDYSAYVRWVMHGGDRVPAALIENYDSWQCRSFLGRYLCQLGKDREGIHVLQSVEDAVLADVPRTDEDRVSCLQHLASAVCRAEKNGQAAALRYIDEALCLINQTAEDFGFIVRGSVWYTRLKILQAGGDEQRALNDADQMIASRAQDGVVNDSYLYYSYRFKAEVAYAKGEFVVAVELMKAALEHFPKAYLDMDDLECIWARRHEDPKHTYEKLEALTHHSAVVGFDA